MMFTFENMRGNASPRGKGTDAPANARWGNTNPRNSNSASGFTVGFAPFPRDEHSSPVAWSRGEETTKHYHSFASAALDPHPTVANPLLPFGKVTQTVIDGLAVVVALLLIGSVGLGILFASFVAFFVNL